ncbi:hypothetical protein K1T71_000497 [Dendrolimus kikuchii]|uniref:Uncharacterized protein n=1 Tax=Dendrolimus kikuchii TaxID=765133 RepID=A0ACC1DK16_9NEOP|nr:hypothetical protein K1T71_000497 [Dendrolimus kikuchii]
MNAGFIKSNTSNLPKIDVFMLGAFFSTNTNFGSAEFRNIKISVYITSYGDDAISHAHWKRDGKLCIVKCKICPEHKVRSRLYIVTLIVDEEDDIIHSIEYHSQQYPMITGSPVRTCGNCIVEIK